MPRVVIIEPHPDDAFIGCYFILNLGVVDKIITVTDGSKELPKPTMPPEKYAEIRKQETLNCSNFFDIPKHVFLGFKDGSLNSSENKELVEKLNREIKDGDLVFIPSYKETHSDHKAVFNSSLLIDRSVNLVQYSVWEPIPDATIVFHQTPAKEILFKRLFPSQLNLTYLVTAREEYL